MSDHERTSTIGAAPAAEGAEVLQFPRTREPKRGWRPRLWRRRRRPRRFKVRKLRVLAVMFFLGILAIVSALFGMFMAVASDLPPLEEPAHQPSVIVDARGREIGTLTGNERRIYLSENEIAPAMKHAIVAIEDRRFYTNSGVDLRGMARAAVEDLRSRGGVQGASTIPQQFVKISLAAENERTVFQKLREAALAYHLTRKWSKDRILRNYLNSIYFGNGAYGIESAAQTYFAYNHDGCGSQKEQSRCASVLLPHEAALLAAMVASPSAFDPTQHPVAARRRRDLVLLRMLDQGYLTRAIYESEKAEPLPTRDDLSFPKEDTEYPYFTSWIKQQVVDRLGGGQQGAQLAFGGGLRVRTTIDARLQKAATDAIRAWLPNPAGPRAALVAIHNDDGEVRAMVGGDDQNFNNSPFNLATQGQRQPGSAFKPFVLAEALRRGIGPGSTWVSAKKTYILKGGERFTVNNYEGAYAGVRTLATATTYSDNAVYAQVGMRVGPRRIAQLARRMGIRTPVSHNAANALGGLRHGVTPLDMAHAYETFAAGGKLVYGTLSPGLGRRLPVPGPVGIERIDRADGDDYKAFRTTDGALVNHVRKRTVLSPGVAGTVYGLLQSVVRQGTGTRAQIPGVTVAGKTGTTEEYGDAWFVGWTKEYTVAVWVGYPDEFKPMKTEFRGGPVAGGTYPASIWKSFMQELLKVDPLPKDEGGDGTGIPAPTVPPGASTGTGAAPAVTAATPSTGTTGTGGTQPPPAATAPPAAATPAPPPPPAPPGGGGRAAG